MAIPPRWAYTKPNLYHSGRIPIRAALIALLLASAASSQPRPTIDRYCTPCHNSRLKSANLALDSASAGEPGARPEIWENVVRRLRIRSMPPAGLPRPTEPAYDALIASLESALDRTAAAHPNPGRTDTLRRLNRAEYRNVIRDLLALDVDPAALLPADDAAHGFDNVTLADLSPTLLERYISAARLIARLALGAPVKSPGGHTLNLPPDLTQERHFEGLPLGTRGGVALPFTFPVDGVYELQARLTRDRNEHVEGLRSGPHQLELLLDGARAALFTVQAPPPGNDHHAVDQHLRIRLRVSAGPHTVAATFPSRPWLLLETERQPYDAHFNNDRHPRLQPAIFSLTVNGPYQPAGPGDTPSRRRILLCSPASPAEAEPCARRILTPLLRRAFRRPVTPADLAGPLAFYRQGLAEGGHQAGLELALRSVLVSPEFLFRVERDPPTAAPGAAYPITPLELASRLSFFLWSSAPDDSLLADAASGALRQPAVLEKHARRLLADPRAAALTHNFAGQWLYLRNLDSTHPDMRSFPAFDHNLRLSFRRETELFFDSIIRQDRPILDLLSADFTFLDERLARHYGIPNIAGSRFRRVSFPPGSHRGGLLRHGSLLTVTSYANRTSPVIRGKWILANLLGVPPPPPPAGIPPLKERAGVSDHLSVRARLAEHRDNPACSGCHRLMDPIGFSLENYDAVGRWRSAEDGHPVDAAGSLPDGIPFHGVDGLERALLARPEIFAGAFTEKLLTYALGRGLTPHDGAAVRAIVRRAAAANYRFSAFLLGILESPPFQMRSAL